jgi:hypothetical protein
MCCPRRRPSRLGAPRPSVRRLGLVWRRAPQGDGPIQHKALSRRDSRPSFADVAARMKRQRNPGSTPRLSTPLPDFAERVIGPATSGRTRSIRATKEREAERRQTRISNLRAPTFILLARGEDRGGGAARVRRDALACRCSTAAFAAANQRRRSAPARASWDAADIRRYLKRACPSPASFSQTGHGAGRASSRSRPGLAIARRRRRFNVIYQCIIENV